MNWVTGIVVYILIWWVALFCVLPWGVRPDPGGPEQSGPGAPENPHMKRKLIITTVLAAVLWSIVYALITADIVSFREIAAGMAREDGVL